MVTADHLDTLKANVIGLAVELFDDVLCEHDNYMVRLSRYIHATKVYSLALCDASRHVSPEVGEAYLAEARHYDISPSYLADVLKGVRSKHGLT